MTCVGSLFYGKTHIRSACVTSELQYVYIEWKYILLIYTLTGEVYCDMV